MNNFAASPFSEYNEIRNGHGPESVNEDQTRSSLAAMNVKSFDTVPQNRTFEPLASQADLLLHSNVADETQLIPSCGLDRKNSIFPHAQSLDHASHEDSLAQSISSRSTPDRGEVEFELVTARGGPELDSFSRSLISASASDQQKMFTSIGFDGNADISPHPHSSNRVSPTGFQNAQKEDEEVDFRLYHSGELLPELNPSSSTYDTPNAFRQDQGAPELESFPGDPESGAQNEMRMFRRYDLSDSHDDVSLHAQYLDDVSEAGLEISHKEGEEGVHDLHRDEDIIVRPRLPFSNYPPPYPHNTLDPLDEFGDDLGSDSSLHAHTSRFAFSPHSYMSYNADDNMQTSDYGTNKSDYDYGMDDPLIRDSESTHFYAGDPFDEIGDSPPSDSTLYPHTPRSTPYVLSSVDDEIQTSDLDGRHEGDNNGQGMEDSLKQDLRYDRFHTGEPSDEFGDNHGSDSSPYLRTTHAFKDEPVSACSPHPPMDIAEDESQTSDIDGRNEGKDDGHRTKDSPDWNSGSAQSHTGDPFDEFGDNNSRSASSSHPRITFDAFDDEPVSACSPHPPMDIAEDESQTSDIDGRNEGKDDGHRTKDSPDWNSGSAQSHTDNSFDEFGDNSGFDSSPYPGTIPNNAFDDEPNFASSPPPMIIVEDELQASDLDGGNEDRDDDNRTEDLLNQDSGYTGEPFNESGDNNPRSASSTYLRTIPNAFDDRPVCTSSPHPHMVIIEDQMQTSDLDGRNESKDDGHRMEDFSLYAYNPQSASLHHPHMSFIAEDQMSDVDGHRMEDPLNQDSEYDHFQTGHPFNEFGDSLGSDSSSYPRTIPNAFDDACNEPMSASSPHPPMVINCEDKMQTSGVDGRDQNEGEGYRLEDLLNQHSGSTRFHASDPFDKFGVNPESGPSPHAHIPWSASSLHPHMSSSAEDEMQTFDFSGRNEGEGEDPSPYAHTPCPASSPHPQMQMSDFFVRNEGEDEGYIMADSLNQKNSGDMQFYAGTWHEIHVDPSDPSHLFVKVPINHNLNVKADNPEYGSYDVNNAHNDAESSYVQPETPADFRFDFRNSKIDSSFYPVHVPLNAINTFELNEDRSNRSRLGPDESERNTGADTSSENSTVDELFQSMPNGQEQVAGYSNHNMHRDTCLNEGDLARIGHQSSSFNTEGLLLVPSPALGINTPSSSDMPSAFDDTGCDADDEGMDDGDGDWDMQYEDVGSADNGNATQISSDYDGVRAFEMEVPHTHMSHNTHVDHHYPPCNSSHETCNCDSRPQNFVSHNHLGVPPVQGDMLMPESHGTFGDTDDQQGVTPLSPLTEIPDIPMAAESSIEDEKYLRTELESLVASCVKSVLMVRILATIYSSF
ncbi:hypothetical protein LENED_007771 [Lentinula edodes]|uniref:Uncharacterized protein n=1 Tax=Lentinula edodes TaxID=5353 RepID=A0A1Q3EFD7_LENED|nr:hypothetical protein LENED_007771 [Lentinula edodes]